MEWERQDFKSDAAGGACNDYSWKDGKRQLREGLRARNEMSLCALILPYLFVFLPALLINGPSLEILKVAGTAIAGLILLSLRSSFC